MANKNDGDETSLKKKSLNRRNILLGGTTLAAATAIATGRICTHRTGTAAGIAGKWQ